MLKVTRRRALDLLVIFLSALLSVSGFFIVDYFYSQSSTPITELDQGWYILKSDFDGYDRWGGSVYKVKTDRNGFRINPKPRILKPEDSSAKIIFLGDSFTYGINGEWDDTFVGMYDEYTSSRIINAGTSSYSPTPYLFQYNKALDRGLLAHGHTVIICLDISDVQDESSYWFDGVNHPIRMTNYSADGSKFDLQKFVRDNFRLTSLIYGLLKQQLGIKPDETLSRRMVVRSGFTNMDWNELNKLPPNVGNGGYFPLGVQGGLNKISDKSKEIVRIAKEYDAKVYFLLYPWPNQLETTEKFDWAKYVNDVCIYSGCDGVIDAQTEFRRYAKYNPSWKSDLYLESDVHFNKRGNEIVFKSLINRIKE